MKPKITILLMLLMTGINLTGQQNYYWSARKKHYVTEVKNKYVVQLSEAASPEQTRSTLRDNGDIQSVIRMGDFTAIVSSERIPLNDLQKQPNILNVLPAYSINNDIAYVTGEILLQPKNGVTINQITALFDKDLSVTQRSKHNTFVLVVNDWNKLFEYANRIYESGLVEYCHPNLSLPIHKAQTQIDPLYPQQYYLNNTGQFGGTSNIDINAPEAWSITMGSNMVRIAVIDDGVEAHEDMVGRLLPGFTARFSPENPNRNGAPNNTNCKPF